MTSFMSVQKIPNKKNQQKFLFKQNTGDLQVFQTKSPFFPQYLLNIDLRSKQYALKII